MQSYSLLSGGTITSYENKDNIFILNTDQPVIGSGQIVLTKAGGYIFDIAVNLQSTNVYIIIKGYGTKVVFITNESDLLKVRFEQVRDYKTLTEILNKIGVHEKK